MTRFEIPDFVPADWVEPEVEKKHYGIVKKYLDGVQVIIPETGEVEGFVTDPQNYETYYPDGSLHFEVGYDDDCNLTEGSTYIQYGWIPKSSN